MGELVNMAIWLAVIIAIMLVSELIAKLTRGRIPMVFMMALFFLIGYWIGMPKDVVDRSQLSGIAMITKSIILIHIATLFDIKALAKDWRVVVTSLFSMVGIVVTVFAASLIMNKVDYAIASIPPLMGGFAAAYLMLEAAPTQTITILVLLVWVLQSFVGYPLTAIFIRKEGQRLVKNYRDDPEEAKASLPGAAAEETKKVLLIDKVPEIIKSPTFILFEMLMFAAVAAGLNVVCQMIFKTSIDLSPIFSVLVGVLARTLGLIDKEPLDKAKCSGIMFLALYASMMTDFAEVTPGSILAMIGPAALLIAVSTVGILLLSLPIGKKFGYTKEMAMAIGLNCYLGFPFNYAITSEQIQMLTSDEEERKFLTDSMMSKMIIGGITSVTVVSCVVATIFMTML